MWKVKREKRANKSSLTCVPLGINYAQEYVFVPPSLCFKAQSSGIRR